MERKRANHLSPIRPCNALACFSSCRDYGERDKGLAIIQGAIEAGYVPLLVNNPLEDGADLGQFPRRDNARRQIDMHFAKASRSAGAQQPHATRRISQNPGEGIPTKSRFPFRPLSPDDSHHIVGRCLRQGKGEPIDGQGEGLICGRRRNVCHDVSQAPVLPRRGRFGRRAAGCRRPARSPSVPQTWPPRSAAYRC